MLACAFTLSRVDIPTACTTAVSRSGPIQQPMSTSGNMALSRKHCCIEIPHLQEFLLYTLIPSTLPRMLLEKKSYGGRSSPHVEKGCEKLMERYCKRQTDHRTSFAPSTLCIKHTTDGKQIRGQQRYGSIFDMGQKQSEFLLAQLRGDNCMICSHYNRRRECYSGSPSARQRSRNSFEE